MASRRQTELEYRKQINKVIIYIQEHINSPPQLEVLAHVAGFSPFHFHRIFAAFVGETIGQYIRRLRLEQAARRLLGSTQNVTNIALAVGYETPSAFTKAFKLHFGVSPSQLREMNKQSAASMLYQVKIRTKQRRLSMKPEIRDLPEQEVLYVRRTGLIDNSFTQAAQEAFTVLMRFIEERNLSKQWSQCLAITPDETSLTPPEDCRYDAGVILRPGVQAKPEGEVAIQVIRAGKWAVFMHKGPYETMWQTWNSAYRDWLPASGEELRDASPYEVYLDDIAQTKPEDLRTEIYIPIK